MGGRGSCVTCFKREQNQADQYQFQVYNKLPYFGELKDHRQVVNGKSPYSGQQKTNIYQSTLDIDRIGGLILPSAAGGSFIPQPCIQTKLSNLFNLKPIQSLSSDTSVFNITKAGAETFVKKIKKSNYATLAKNMEGTDQKFNDLQFPPNHQSLGNQFDSKNVKWLRITQILKDPIFVSENINPNDILQGILGDCYFFSAIASLAQRSYRVKNIFPSLQINPNGIYMARVLYNGVFQQVVVDDFFPVNDLKQPLFAKPTAEKIIWVMILQKVWAKLYGSYESIDGGSPYQVSHAFSFAPVYLKKVPTDIKKRQDLWKHLLQVYQKGYLLCGGTNDDSAIDYQGILQGHSYTILGVYEKPCKLLKLRNPWGRRQFTGRASDYDNNFWKQVSETDKKTLGYDDIKRTERDGVFFIVWQDFLKFFNMIDICKINDNAHYNFLKSDFGHKVPKLFQFQFRENTTNVSFAITQPSIRSSDVEKYSRSYLALGKWDAESKSYKYVKSCSDRRMADNYLQLKAVSAGKYVLYAIYLWTTENTNKAVVSIYSQSPVHLQEINQSIDPQTFLKQIFYDHATKNTKKTIINEYGDWVCNEILLNQGGFSYFVAEVSKKSKWKLGVTLNQSQYLQKKLQLQPSIKGCQVLKKEVDNSQPFIVVAQLLTSVFPATIISPSPKVVMLQ